MLSPGENEMVKQWPLALAFTDGTESVETFKASTLIAAVRCAQVKYPGRLKRVDALLRKHIEGN